MTNKYINSRQISLKYETPENIIKLINDAWMQYGKDNVTFEHEDGSGNYDSEIYLLCKYPMTQKQQQKAVEREQLAQKQHEEYLLRQYEQLKKRFDNA